MISRREFLAMATGAAGLTVGGAVGVFDPVRRRTERRAKARGLAAAAGVRPRDLMTAKQLAVMDSPARFKVLLVGRRGGKTIGAVGHASDAMLQGPKLLLFLAKTIGSAREIMWEPFKRLNREHDWGFKFNEGLHIVTHPRTGARLLVRGIDDKEELEKLRGPSFDHIYIDECGTHKPSMLKYLVEEVLDATLMDRAESTLWLLGTPTVQAHGHFYKASTGLDDGEGLVLGYDRFHWTARDNPHVNFERHIFDPRDGVLVRRSWTTDTPAFRREYLAEWIVETERRVFRFERARNVLRELPELRHGDSWFKVLVLDFGVNDAFAMSRMQSPRTYGRATYITKGFSKRGLAPSQAAELIAAEVEAFQPDAVVGDSGGIGKAFLQEHHLRYPGLKPITPAEKSEKRTALEWCSDALFCATTGASPASPIPLPGDIGKHEGLFIVDTGDGSTATIQRQFASLLWDEDREDIAEGQDDDEAMTGVYGYRRMRAFRNKQRPEIPIENLPPNQRHLAIPQLSEQQRAFLEGWNQGPDE